ncbi:MAG TPA: nucleoside-diphosphate kinase [Streptosporangiaceae bacterium]|nr:nucleoside-diphosphate kinase [Streptosporangiaceae bacterium]
MTEETLVVIKPDGVARGLTGRIIEQFLDAGLVLTRLELRSASADLIERHYPDDEAWLSSVGGKTIADYERLGLDPAEFFGGVDPVAIGRVIKNWLVDYLTQGPVVAMVLRGNEAIGRVRTLCGNTVPAMADPSTIRGRFSSDSAAAANAEKRPIQNLVHASGNAQEANYEIGLWFPS